MKKPSYLIFVLIFLLLATCETYHLYSEKKKEAVHDNLSEKPSKFDRWLNQFVQAESASKTETENQDIIDLPLGLHPIF